MLARTELDAHIRDRRCASLVERPPRGWIRAIRDALGMTSRQLAARLNVSQPAVAQFERSEVDGRIKLDTLRRVADALECDLAYVFVPRGSLDDIVRSRAHEAARAEVATVDRTMRLEDQGLTVEQLERRVDDYAARLITAGRLWDEPARGTRIEPLTRAPAQPTARLRRRAQ
jgi:predicted DNA-binding mobile mystery protein A